MHINHYIQAWPEETGSTGAVVAAALTVLLLMATLALACLVGRRWLARLAAWRADRRQRREIRNLRFATVSRSMEGTTITVEEACRQWGVDHWQFLKWQRRDVLKKRAFDGLPKTPPSKWNTSFFGGKGNSEPAGVLEVPLIMKQLEKQAEGLMATIRSHDDKIDQLLKEGLNLVAVKDRTDLGNRITALECYREDHNDRMRRIMERVYKLEEKRENPVHVVDPYYEGRRVRHNRSGDVYEIVKEREQTPNTMRCFEVKPAGGVLGSHDVWFINEFTCMDPFDQPGVRTGRFMAGKLSKFEEQLAQSQDQMMRQILGAFRIPTKYAETIVRTEIAHAYNKSRFLGGRPQDDDPKQNPVGKQVRHVLSGRAGTVVREILDNPVAGVREFEVFMPKERFYGGAWNAAYSVRWLIDEFEVMSPAEVADVEWNKVFNNVVKYEDPCRRNLWCTKAARHKGECASAASAWRCGNNEWCDKWYAHDLSGCAKIRPRS